MGDNMGIRVNAIGNDVANGKYTDSSYLHTSLHTSIHFYTLLYVSQYHVTSEMDTITYFFQSFFAFF